MIAVSDDTAAPEPLADNDIIIEITNLIFAGTDTTGNTFSYMFWELAKNPEWQGRLRDELSTIQFDNVPDYQDVMKLPVLDALIHETLRFWPASPASLPRVTPKGGRTIDGVKVPENVSIRRTEASSSASLINGPSRLLSHVRATARSEIRNFSHSQMSFGLSGGLMRIPT